METSVEQQRSDAPERRGRPLVLAGAGVALALAIILGVVAFGSPASDTAATIGRDDVRIDGEVLEALGAEGEVRLAAYRGKPLVVNFFASWCTFCIAEMPDFEKVHQALGDHVAFLGVAMNDTPGAALRMADATGISYDLADDPEGRFFESVGATGMPTTLFVDDTGRVVEKFSGPLSENALRDRLDKHFSV